MKGTLKEIREQMEKLIAKYGSDAKLVDILEKENK